MRGCAHAAERDSGAWTGPGEHFELRVVNRPTRIPVGGP